MAAASDDDDLQHEVNSMLESHSFNGNSNENADEDTDEQHINLGDIIKDSVQINNLMDLIVLISLIGVKLEKANLQSSLTDTLEVIIPSVVKELNKLDKFNLDATILQKLLSSPVEYLNDVLIEKEVAAPRRRFFRCIG